MSQLLDPRWVTDYVRGLLSPVMHDARANSIAQAVIGVICATRLSIAEVGRAMARARGTSPKHGIKQIDRLLSNPKFDVEEGFRTTVPWIVGGRSNIVVSLDWTDYDSDGQSRIAVNLVTAHGRATPLVWLTVLKSGLKGNRNRYESEALYMLHRVLPREVGVIVLADRGFCDVALYEMLQEELAWDFVIRFRSTIYVSDARGKRRKAKEWVPRDGSILHLKRATVTHLDYPVGVVFVKRRMMKDAWHLATSLSIPPTQIVKLYGRRFTCEENFRDEKDLRFGFGLKETHVGSPERRDRLLFVSMIAMVLLTLVGAAGEELGFDRQLRANTARKRTHSLLRQGREYVLGVLRQRWDQLRESFLKIIDRHPSEIAVYGLI